MASSFDRWEKDPFFSAAEEVQESADRMESTYRTWIHAKKDASSMWDSEGLRRDLHTVLGTAKWQLEEFERAVRSSYVKDSNDDSRDRHREFVNAIDEHIRKIENSLEESAVLEGKTSLPWVRLDEGESNELALFLSGPPLSRDNPALKNNREKEKRHETGNEPIPGCLKKTQSVEWGSLDSREKEKGQEMGKESTPGCLKMGQSVEWGSLDVREDKSHGHRRTASASADIGTWKIVIAEEGLQVNSSNGPAPRLPRKVPSLSGILSSMESASKIKWPKNGVRKWKAMDICQESDAAPLQSSELPKGINTCYEKSKSCLDGCDECYDKQLYGWYGAIQRQLQRSQYQMQYSRPVQAAFWIILLFCLIVLIALRGL